MYSASVEESVTVNWDFNNQLMGLLLNMKMYLEVNFLVS